jgi:hypothetical protein
MCRRLFLSFDRPKDSELVMTPKLIANMLSVRRERITKGALRLQKAGLIRYVRGYMTIFDRAGLSAGSRECSAAAKIEYVRLLTHRIAIRKTQASLPLVR